MKKQILFTFTILVLAVCLIGAVSAEAADETGLTLSGDAINDTTTSTTTVETGESTPDVTITGEVQKCSDGEPFPGVTVTVTSSEETILTTTNADGTYSLNFKSNSTNFRVTASAPGHQTSTQEVTVLPGEDNNYQATANFKLGMDTVYVATTGNDDTGDGTQANPYKTIGKGITEVNPDGTVNVADGTYSEHLTINKNLNLVGTSQTGTIIDGTNNGRPVTIGTGAIVSINLFTIQNGRTTGYDAYGGGIYNNGNLTLNNCTVKNNRANPTGFYGSSYGGGIYNSGDMTIKGSNVEYNTGTGYYAYGGGINNWGTMIIEDSTIQYNGAYSSSDEALGGGIYNEIILTIINSTINGNKAQSSYPDEARGGGIYNYGTLIMDNSILGGNVVSGYDAYGGGICSRGTMEISNSNINNNLAEASGSSCYGGGIYINGGSLTLTDSNINQNTVTGQPGNSAEGGGIYNSGGTMTITGGSVSSNRINGGDASGGGISISWGYHNIVTINGCTIQDNAIYSTSTSNGGGVYYHAGHGYNTATMTINDSTIKGNTATNGGGIYNYQSTLTITGSTIQENNAVYGAGIGTTGTATISDSIISDNSASHSGGGIYNYGTVMVFGSTIRGNTANYGGGIYNYYGTVTANFNRILCNSPITMQNDDGSVDAQYNWWGSNNPDFTALIVGDVDYNPWLYMTFQVDPSTISQGETSTLTANINNAFDGETVTPLNPADGHLPDDNLVTFSTDLGEVGSQSVDKPTVDGVATATLTGTESGIANVSAMLDDETLTDTVEVKSDLCANVTITKTGNGPLNVGDTGTFTIILHNYGPDAAHNVVVTDLGVPTGWTVNPSVGSWDSATNAWNVGTLQNNADATLTISGIINAAMAGTNINNTATETQDEPKQESQTATANITVNPITHRADLYINSWSSKTNPNVGEIYTITFKLGNNGPNTAEKVVLTLPLPDGVEFVDVEVDQGTASYDPVTRTITWTLGDVIVGDPYVWVRVRASSVGSFIFKPTLTTDTYDPTINSMIQAVTVNVQAAGESTETIHAQTVGMQETGAPAMPLVLSVLSILGGLLTIRKKQ